MVGETSPSGRGAPERYRVIAVEPDDRFRTRITLELAGIAPAPLGSIEQLLSELHEGDPAVVVFGPGLATDTGLAHAQKISRSFPEVGIVLLAKELTLALLQEALRAGIRDAVALDVDVSQVRQAIERVGEAVAAVATRNVVSESEAYGRVIVAFSTKGGVGKSVIATNLAVSLAGRDVGDVVLLDADLQFGDVAVLLGIPPIHTIAEAAGAIETADAQFMDGLLASHETTSLRVLPAPIEPSAGDQITPESMVAIVRLLRTMFDYVIIDMPPHFDDVVLALLEEADDVLLVASMDIPSIKNLKVGIQTLNLLEVAGSKLRLVLNRANAKVNLDVGDVERALGVSAEFRVPSDISVPQSVNRGVPVVLDKPRSAAALALTTLANCFVQAEPSDGAESESRRRTWRRPE